MGKIVRESWNGGIPRKWFWPSGMEMKKQACLPMKRLFRLLWTTMSIKSMEYNDKELMYGNLWLKMSQEGQRGPIAKKQSDYGDFMESITLAFPDSFKVSMDKTVISATRYYKLDMYWHIRRIHGNATTKKKIKTQGLVSGLFDTLERAVREMLYDN